MDGCPKSSLRGGKTKFLEFFFHRGIHNKNFGKERIFRYRLPEDFLSKGQKNTGEWGVQRPPPHW